MTNVNLIARGGLISVMFDVTSLSYANKLIRGDWRRLVSCSLYRAMFNYIEWRNKYGTFSVSYTHLTLPTKRIV